MLDPANIGVTEIRDKHIGEISSLEAEIVVKASTLLDLGEAARNPILDHAKEQLKRRVWNSIYGEIRKDIQELGFAMMTDLTKDLSPTATSLYLTQETQARMKVLHDKLNPKF